MKSDKDSSPTQTSCPISCYRLNLSWRCQRKMQDQLRTAIEKQSAPLSWTDALNRKKLGNWLQENTTWYNTMFIHFVQGQLWQNEGAREDAYQINSSLHVYLSFLTTSTAFLTTYHRQRQLVAPQPHTPHRLFQHSSHLGTWCGVRWHRELQLMQTGWNKANDYEG